MVIFTAAVASHPLIPARAAASPSLGYTRAAGDVVLPSSKALMLQPVSRKELGTHRLCCLLLSVAESCCAELANMLVAPPRCGTGAFLAHCLCHRASCTSGTHSASVVRVHWHDKIAVAGTHFLWKKHIAGKPSVNLPSFMSPEACLSFAE